MPVCIKPTVRQTSLSFEMHNNSICFKLLHVGNRTLQEYHFFFSFFACFVFETIARWRQKGYEALNFLKSLWESHLIFPNTDPKILKDSCPYWKTFKS